MPERALGVNKKNKNTAFLLLTTSAESSNLAAMIQFQNEIEKHLRAGMTPRQIMNILPVGGSVITHIRQKIGMPEFRRGAPPGYRNSALPILVKKLKGLGLSYGQIGRALGFSHQRAQQYVAKQNKDKDAAFGNCWNCGKLGHHHRHHDDYGSPDTKLLCLSCHSKYHQQRAREIRDGGRPVSVRFGGEGPPQLSDALAETLAALKRKGKASPVELYEYLKMTKHWRSVATHHRLQRLRILGLVDRVRQGRNYIYTPTKALKAPKGNR